MEYLLKNANVYIDSQFRKTDVFIKDNIKGGSFNEGNI